MKNFLIIGGSTGIGAALVERLAVKHNVLATYNQNHRQSNGQAQYFPYQVGQEALGFDLPEVIDGFCYCPGAIDLKPFGRISPESFVQDFDFQVVGAIRVLQEILPKLKKSERASVLFFSTVAVQNGFPYHAQVAASKGALEGLTKSLAAEFAPKIRVNCIAPSLTNTPLAGRLLNTPEKIQANADRHPLKKVGTPEDLSAAAEFLLSDDSDWISGQILGVDGGMSNLKM